MDEIGQINKWLSGIAVDDTLKSSSCHRPECLGGYVTAPDGSGAILFSGGAPVLCECRSEEIIEKRERRYVKSVKFMVGSIKAREVSALDREVGVYKGVRKSFKKHREKFPNATSIILSGPPGCGKTGCAHLLAMDWMRHKETPWPCLFVSIPDFSLAWGSQVENQQSRILSARTLEICTSKNYLVVIDDLGAERTGGTASEKVSEVLDSRCTSASPTIITTNIPVDGNDFSERYGSAVYKRVLDNPAWMCVMSVDGENLRRCEKSC